MKRIINSLNNRHVSAWLNKIVAPVRKSQKTLLPSQNSLIREQLQILESRFQGALRFLKKTKITKSGRRFGLQHHPWYLLIGSIDSGKTTLLANSKINFILEKQIYQNNASITSSESCDWWITSDSVLIDVPGKYFTSKGKKNSSSSVFWQYFLELIQKKRGKTALNGVIITLSLAEIMVMQEREQLLEDLKLRLNTLREKFGDDLPFYFTITKCDLLPGFLDFFNDYSSEELAQAWGITFPSSFTNESLTDTFITRFNALIKRLNTHVIWRLHQERNPYAKFYIKDFPLQLERLKEVIAEMIRVLSAEGTLHLKGVYLTSATQPIVAEQVVSHPELMPAEELQQSFQIMHTPHVSRYSYFVKQFILHGLA